MFISFEIFHLRTMKKIYFSALFLSLLGVQNGVAQDIYKVQQFSATDLNGDARYIGMGGAMSALGANLSAMGNNPASTGLYRRGDAAITGSLFTQSDKNDVAAHLGSSATNTSLDQAGFLYSLNVNGDNLKFVNLGFNYKKSRNFRNLISLKNVPLLGGTSQTWQMRDLAFTTSQGWLDLKENADRGLTTPLANLGYDVFLIDPIRDGAGKVTDYKHGYAEAYHYHRAQKGGIQQYDFNLAFNLNNRLYMGVNVGVYDIQSQSMLEYEEASLDESGVPFQDAQGRRKTYLMKQIESVSGTGVDAKFGVIARPFAEHPFRLGVAMTLPTFYTLSSSSRLFMSSPYEHTNTKTGEHYEYTESSMESNTDYYMRSPLKVNFSLGTTIGQDVAIGAEYEIADHTTAQVRQPDSNYYDGGWSSGTQDKDMQQQIDAYLLDTHTFRVGVEARLAPEFYARAGYNFVSAPIRKEAILNLFTTSPSYRFATNTDYVNLGVTNRITCGLGYRGRNFYTDIAYQYQTQKADVYPFAYKKDGVAAEHNDLPAQHIKLNRHQIALTFGYRF